MDLVQFHGRNVYMASTLIVFKNGPLRVIHAHYVRLIGLNLISKVIKLGSDSSEILIQVFVVYFFSFRGIPSSHFPLGSSFLEATYFL